MWAPYPCASHPGVMLGYLRELRRKKIAVLRKQASLRHLRFFHTRAGHRAVFDTGKVLPHVSTFLDVVPGASAVRSGQQRRHARADVLGTTTQNQLPAVRAAKFIATWAERSFQLASVPWIREQPPIAEQTEHDSAVVHPGLTRVRNSAKSIRYSPRHRPGLTKPGKREPSGPNSLTMVSHAPPLENSACASAFP